MAAVASQFQIGERLRTFLPSVEERKGLLLSHLLGFALFAEFALNIFKFTIPFTPVTSIPIRLIAIWLLIDRNGRVGRLRVTSWDYLILGFALLTGIGCLYTATTSPGVPVDFVGFRKFMGVFLGFYVYYLVAKEGLNRRGFRADIAINWLLAAFAWSAMVGLMQTLNLFHARTWSSIYGGDLLSAVRDVSEGGDNTSFASGTANWWTTMALEMLLAFALVFGPAFRRRPYWWEWALGVLFMGAFIATQSRGGLLAFGACAVATFLYYLYHKKYLVASVIAGTLVLAVGLWVFVVFALQIEKFTVSLKGEKVRGSEYTQSVSGRFEQQRDLIDIGLRQPVFGTGPNMQSFPGAGAPFMIWSSYSHNGADDTMYATTFAQFGVVGLGFLLVLQGYLIYFIRTTTAYRPYAFAAFFMGIAFSVHGLAEFFLEQRCLIVMSVIAAYASHPRLLDEKGAAFVTRITRVPVGYGAGPD